MKIIMYSVRSEEQPFIDIYAAAHPDLQIETHAEVLTQENIEWAKGSDAVCILPRGPVTRDMFARLHAFGIHIFATRSVGYETFDLVAAREFGITITNVPSYSPSAIAEFAVALTLDLFRNTRSLYRRVEQQNFVWQGLMGREINGQTVGIVGTGHIGAVAAKAFAGFGAQVIAYDKYPKAELSESGLLTYVDSLDELFAAADIISFHCPLTPENTGCVNDDSIKLMKDGVHIINTARGKLIDSKALLAGLRSGKVAGAALDVYDNEAPYYGQDWNGKEIEDETLNAFLAMDNVLITPHVAFYTHVAIQNMVDIALNSVLEVAQTGTSRNIVQG
ncbi:D-2-hydroxyacid dehydrogenase [Culicoidibacter larvae]|uniref:D-2-hydroxyacid dehydrogenase n=1 Tax=Culicoidibacter larvae TaxID=2579976 RepID=A0A5R8Q879_9FIRM|nr:D-2-hydroxyacid dehydrogenase [Culicoidibacter larvae]TLG71787.1 D-2-hydroxyacid dehydrogenase [Culicoidibacter larvae]